MAGLEAGAGRGKRTTTQMCLGSGNKWKWLVARGWWRRETLEGNLLCRDDMCPQPTRCTVRWVVPHFLLLLDPLSLRSCCCQAGRGQARQAGLTLTGRAWAWAACLLEVLAYSRRSVSGREADAVRSPAAYFPSSPAAQQPSLWRIHSNPINPAQPSPTQA